jgi:hypothetical protein
MSIHTYRVVTDEKLRRTYLVTTSGDEARAAELAQTGDYGLRDETVELQEDYDNVCDVSILEVVIVDVLEGSPAA